MPLKMDGMMEIHSNRISKRFRAVNLIPRKRICTELKFQRNDVILGHQSQSKTLPMQYACISEKMRNLKV